MRHRLARLLQRMAHRLDPALAAVPEPSALPFITGTPWQPNMTATVAAPVFYRTLP